jgi:conjugal transfer pilus assembly protein TraU
MIIHPEAFLYNNVLAQSACSADCLSANLALARDELHWCSGCQGNMYPTNNNVTAHTGGVQASTNVTERLVYKMHKAGLAEDTAATTMEGTCKKSKSLIMKKSTYRYQMVNPNPDKCQQFGKSTMFFEMNKEIPVVGEDFGYLIWRKRNCCIW